jgi:NAD(P) transhydrogenase subunit alpha
MYSNNITRFLLNMVKNGQLAMNLEDEIVRETCVAHEGQVAHPKIRELLGLPEPPPAADDEGGPTEPTDAALPSS